MDDMGYSAGNISFAFYVINPAEHKTSVQFINNKAVPGNLKRTVYYKQVAVIDSHAGIA